MNLVVIGVKMKNKKPSKKLLKAIKEGNDILNGKKIVKSYHNMYEMLKDARREFIGEGQIFYMYKRLAREMFGIEGNVFPTEENYVIPLPENETNI